MSGPYKGLKSLVFERWVLMDGCIWTERTFEWTSPNIRTIMLKDVRALVLPNVGEELGRHLVYLHNFYLPPEITNEPQSP